MYRLFFVLLSLSFVMIVLSGCEQRKSAEVVVPGTEDFEPAATPLTQVGISQLITENGQPVGIQQAGFQIRFPTPQAKLYTDPTAFSSAVEEGLAAFFISPVQPPWESSCIRSADKIGVQNCQTRGVYLLQMRAEFPETSVWLAIPNSAAVEVGELYRVEGDTFLE